MSDATNPQSPPPVPVQVLPYMTPVQLSAEPATAWADRDKLVVAKQTHLPARCVKCNADVTDGWVWKKRVYWCHPAWYLLILVNLIVAAIVILCIRKWVYVEATLCPEHRSKRRRALAISTIVGVLGVAGLIGGIVWIVEQGNRIGAEGPVMMLVGFILMIVGVVWGTRASTMLLPVRVDDHFGWLKGAGREFLATFPAVTG